MRGLAYVETEPQIVRLSDPPAGASGRATIEQTILREGSWKHAGAPGGVLAIDKPMLDDLAANFAQGVGLGGDSLPFHFGHTEDKDERSVAWGHAVKVVPDTDRPGKHKMVALARFTSGENEKSVLNGEYAFTSPTLLFNHKDRETGAVHKAVIRNVAFTNYPYLQKMGAAKVVNLSDVAAVANGGGQGAGLDFGTGGPKQGKPNIAGLPDGYDPTELPTECLACAKLGNDCPFADAKADTDLTLKQAAAGSGNCPQYVEADSQTPGGGGAADAASASPAAGRQAKGTLPLSEGADPAPEGDGDPEGDENAPVSPEYGRMLFEASECGSAGTPLNGFAAKHGTAVHAALRHKHLAQFEKKPAGAKRGDGSKPLPHVRLTRQGQAALARHVLHEKPKRVALSDQTHAAPFGANRTPFGAKGPTMNQAQIDKLLAQAREREAAEQRTFVTALAETHKLPAAALKAIEEPMTEGAATSIALSEALEGAEGEFVRLSEKPDEAVVRPKALDKLPATLDLSETITIPKAQYRAAILAAASAERTGEVQLSDTKDVNGKKPDDKPADDLAQRVQAEKDPEKALALARAGK